MVVIAHSMGNGVFRYFLEWLKLELGRNNWQPWIDKHISAYFAVGSPLLGSSEALELLSSGLTQGLPVSQREIRKLVATFGTRVVDGTRDAGSRSLTIVAPLATGSIISFLPVPSTLNATHDSETLIHVRFENAPGAGSGEREKSYTSAEIASGQFFRDMAKRDPIFSELEQVRERCATTARLCFNTSAHDDLRMRQILRERRRARLPHALGAPADRVRVLGLRRQPAGASSQRCRRELLSLEPHT